jgi:hypothetical protein
VPLLDKQSDVCPKPCGAARLALQGVGAGGGAINSLFPFALRNLVASIWRPDTLAVRQSDVVCVYLDEHSLRVLRAVHVFLMDDESGEGGPGQSGEQNCAISRPAT